jgi:hypothetical protein
LLHAEFGKQRAKCAQFFGEKRADRFNGHVFFRNSGSAAHQNHLGAGFFDPVFECRGNDLGIVGNHLMKDDSVSNFSGLLADPFAAGVIDQCPGCRDANDADTDGFRCLLFVFVYAHGSGYAVINYRRKGLFRVPGPFFENSGQLFPY